MGGRARRPERWEVGETEEGRGPAVSDIPDQPGGLLYVP